MEGAAGPLMKRQGCPVLSALPLIWAAAPGGPLTFPHFLPKLPQWRMSRVFPLLSGRFRRLMRAKHATPFSGMNFWEERNLGLG